MYINEVVCGNVDWDEITQ